MTKWRITNLEFANQVVIAPMAGITNQAFREVCLEFGSGLVFGEMISDQALLAGNKRTLEMIKISQVEHPIALQLFGSNPKTMALAAEYLDQNTTCDLIDINMGCPVTKVIKAGSGAALMKTPELAVEIVEQVIKRVKKPVTVKLRAGWDKNSINVVKLAKQLAQAGASALTIHARTRSEMYAGQADWDLIRQVKQAVKLPVIGNGDVKSGADALRLRETTNCDAIMVGRAVLGNPWLIKELIAALDQEPIKLAPPVTEVFHYLKEHYEKLSALKGPKMALLEMRTHAAWYLSGLAFNTKIKPLINQIKEVTLLWALLAEYEELLVQPNLAAEAVSALVAKYRPLIDKQT